MESDYTYASRGMEKKVKVVTIILLFIFLLNFISFASADSFSMNYIGNSGDVISISSGIEDQNQGSAPPVNNENNKETISISNFSDLLLCALPNYFFPFNIWISTDCFKKLIDMNYS